MKPNHFVSLLRSIHRKSYPAYKSLQGSYAFPLPAPSNDTEGGPAKYAIAYQCMPYTLSIDHVQGDPFASPSNVSVTIEPSDHGFPKECWQSISRRIAFCDYLTRQFSKQLIRFSFQAKGSGKSGLISISHCGPEILERTACTIKNGTITMRFFIGFPANGRTINALELEKILLQFLPSAIQQSLSYKTADQTKLRSVLHLADDQDYIRQQLKERNLCAFVANGSILPRESGISSAPLQHSIPFQAPKSLELTLNLPFKGAITGMAIPRGITLIVGGGYHGKSTLLNALELGVYNHIEGDGREYVISDSTGVKLRSEDGRFINDVDISLFISDLPNQKNTRSFTTLDASGSTSQAAGIMETLETGSSLLFMDEDTSATNFMVRDFFMQEIIQKEKEPITPFLERARDLYEKAGLSTILVAGSSGAFFHIADTIIQMDCYLPVDITSRVKEKCAQYQAPALTAPGFRLPSVHRTFTAGISTHRPSDHSRNSRSQDKLKLLDIRSFSLGKTVVDLRYIEQLIDAEQTACLGMLLKHCMKQSSGKAYTISQLVTAVQQQLNAKGITSFFPSSYVPCGYAVPRIQEIYACLNRYRYQ